jgi:serine protease Do
MTTTNTRHSRSTRRRRSSMASLLALAGLATLTACGDSVSIGADAPASTTSTTSTTTAAAPDTTTAPEVDEPVGDDPSFEPSGAVSTLDGVRSATVRIEAQGTFVDPDFGAYEGAGSGSGFVIDPSGIAVTNNHVVTGAGLLQVHVDGETRPRNARVLGVSECSDLAVIKIDGPELPWLEWFEGTAEPGLDVYAAGFPLGDPEYTLTRGIVAKARAFGDTPWASIDHVLEHDANIQPGNSGGPLVVADGRVAGVDYAAASFTNQSQFFAIAASDARPIVEQLRQGKNVDSIGVNSQAIVSDDGSLSGVWVAGVASGSIADQAGIQAGDIITRLEGVTLGVDGTMRDYCDVLRSHAPDAQLAVEVLRYATSEVLEGRLNGPRLETAFSFADVYADEVAGDPTGAIGYTEYVSVVDDTGTITVTVPAEWFDVDGAPVDLTGDGSAMAASITAAPDLMGFTNSWTVPGVEFIAGEALMGLSPAEMLDFVAPSECVSDGRNSYDDGAFAGLYEVFGTCAGGDTSYFVVATHAADGSVGVLVAIQVVTEADLEALDTVLATFDLAG